MSTFFGLNLVSVVPDNAVMHKQTLTADQAAVLIREGIIPCSAQDYQVLEQIASDLGVTPSPTKVLDVELSIGDNFLMLNSRQGNAEDKSLPKFTLWTRLA